MLHYKAIEIFTSESARYRTKSVVDAVIHYIRSLKIATRCIVTRGIAGCYENGELANTRLEVLSSNLPVRIYITVPASNMDEVLDGLESIVGDGLIAMHDLDVFSHRARNTFFPRHLKVRDVMTPEPESVKTAATLNEAARLFTNSIFTGLPVVDDRRRPVGIITQGDLIRQGGLPLRLESLLNSDRQRFQEIQERLSNQQVSEIMTTPAVVISDENLLSEAVSLMMEKEVKRLPVVDRDGCLTGILSRLDIFRTVMREKPDWNTFRAQDISIRRLKNVHDILRRETQTVSPETTLDKVVQLIDLNDIQRVAVVDSENKLLGLISDLDLLIYFKPEQEGIWRFLSKVKQFINPVAGGEDIRHRLTTTTADAIMNTRLETVNEDTLIEEAIALMTDNGLKRLPVVDAEGRFKGLISRDSLLRSGFSTLFPEDNN